MPRLADLAAVSRLLVVTTLCVLCGCGGEPDPTEGRAGTPGAHDQPPPDPTAGLPDYDHEPRFVDAGGEHPHTNRLIDETSPYLLQHAHNPVDWYAWGPEAFEAARRENKPIFLSVGYSTCYWCHVMERESFEDEATGAYMNDHFICIKLDREERPDIDDIYMTAVHAMGKRGGWPMSVFLEPKSLRPFFAGTYFPKVASRGRPSFATVMEDITARWRSEPDAVRAEADQIAQRVRQRLTSGTTVQLLTAANVDQAIDNFLVQHDGINGGFRTGAPKFPIPPNLQFLMHAGWEDQAMRQALLLTLDRMAMGGLYDQIGGGFHRYSTDQRWLVPHFEKMLYDNAQLVSVYADAYERTGDPYYAIVIRQTLDYVLREMTGPDGRLYSAQDAEVAEREGGSYVWTTDEVRLVLSEAGLLGDVELALAVYGLDGGPNFQDPHHREEPPRNVLHLPAKREALAAAHGVSLEELDAARERINAALLTARNRREQPITDDKTLVAWNGLMIAALAEGGRVLNEQRYVQAAHNAARFILINMRTADRGLYRTYRDGHARIDAFMEDYAFLLRGLLALNWATGDAAYLEQAVDLAALARARFFDEESGGYFDTLPGQTDLFMRTKSYNDGVIPSANAVMVHVLLDLYRLTGEPRYLDDAATTLGFLSGRIVTMPTSTSMARLALQRFLDTHPDRLPGRKPTG